MKICENVRRENEYGKRRNCGFVVVWLFLCEFAVRKIPSNGVSQILYFWSKNVTVIYFIQWIIIGWGVAVFSYMGESITVTVILMAAAVLLTHWTAKRWLIISKNLNFRLK